MKVRIGFGLGTQTPTQTDRFGALVDALERCGYDSLWCSERVSGPAPDPIVALSIAAGRTERLKLGTSVQVLPGRNPVSLAVQWASLDALSGGRALPAFGLGVVHPHEQQAFGVERGERATWFDEAITLIRRCWTDDVVTHHGERFQLEGVPVQPKPVQSPPDVWLGGRAPSELRRVGRLGDGWLASFTSPTQCAAGREIIEEAAGEAGRSIDPEHYGAMVFYTTAGIPDALAHAVAQRNPEVAVEDLVVDGVEHIAARCEEYVGVGFTKLVLVPMIEPDVWDAHLEAVASSVLRLQT